MKTTYPGISSRLVGGAIYTVILVVAVSLGFLSRFIPLGFFLLVSLLMAGEALKAMSLKIPEITLFPALGGMLFILIPPLFWLDSKANWLTKAGASVAVSLLLLGVFALFTAMSQLIRHGHTKISAAVSEAGTALYVFGAFSVLAPLLLFVPRGLIWLILALLAPAISDVFAYFGGVRFGKRKIVPQLSPSKTWSGTLFGVLGSVLLSLLFFLVWLKPTALPSFWSRLLLAIVSGIFLSLVSQAGDWFASAIKRFIGIKDFSTLIPGHGGLFDRLDSFLPVLPTVFLLSLYVEAVLS